MLCTRYERANKEERAVLESDYNAHLARNESAKKSHQEDKVRASIDSSFATATFDLQSVLQIPDDDTVVLQS